jgi:hypothetical protein
VIGRKTITVAKSKELLTGWSNSRQIWHILLRKAAAQKGLFYRSWWQHVMSRSVGDSEGWGIISRQFRDRGLYSCDG